MYIHIYIYRDVYIDIYITKCSLDQTVNKVICSDVRNTASRSLDTETKLIWPLHIWPLWRSRGKYVHSDNHRNSSIVLQTETGPFRRTTHIAFCEPLPPRQAGFAVRYCVHVCLRNFSWNWVQSLAWLPTYKPQAGFDQVHIHLWLSVCRCRWINSCFSQFYELARSTEPG